MYWYKVKRTRTVSLDVGEGKNHTPAQARRRDSREEGKGENMKCADPLGQLLSQESSEAGVGLRKAAERQKRGSRVREGTKQRILRLQLIVDSRFDKHRGTCTCGSRGGGPRGVPNFGSTMSSCLWERSK